MPFHRLLTTLLILSGNVLKAKSEETTESSVDPESTSFYDLDPELESNNTGIVLVTLTILILLLPFIGICCYMVNVRYRFLIFDLFFKRRKTDETLQCKRLSKPGSFYHRLSDANTGVNDYVNQKLLKLYPEVKRFGEELPPAFRLQKNVLLVPQTEHSPSCVGLSQAATASKMENELMNPSKTDIKITVEFVEPNDPYKEPCKEAQCLQSNAEI